MAFPLASQVHSQSVSSPDVLTVTAVEPGLTDDRNPEANAYEMQLASVVAISVRSRNRSTRLRTIETAT